MYIDLDPLASVWIALANYDSNCQQFDIYSYGSQSDDSSNSYT
jgi:hypothetical protein